MLEKNLKRKEKGCTARVQKCSVVPWSARVPVPSCTHKNLYKNARSGRRCTRARKNAQDFKIPGATAFIGRRLRCPYLHEQMRFDVRASSCRHFEQAMPLPADGRMGGHSCRAARHEAHQRRANVEAYHQDVSRAAYRPRHFTDDCCQIGAPPMMVMARAMDLVRRHGPTPLPGRPSPRVAHQAHESRRARRWWLLLPHSFMSHKP